MIGQQLAKDLMAIARRLRFGEDRLSDAFSREAIRYDGDDGYCDLVPVSIVGDHRRHHPCSLCVAGVHHEHQVLTESGWVTLPAPDDSDPQPEKRQDP